jgi:ATP-dependent Clp protease protease subunit
MKTADRWYNRLATPVAKKMGLTLDQFTKAMYRHNADADWEEFGTDAKKLKWVDNVVERIVETGIIEEKPEAPVVRIGFHFSDGCEMKADAKGTPFIQLPVLENPFDCWWLYDKRGLYKAQ